MLQRLPIALTQVKTGNTSENLLFGIRKKRKERKLLKNYIAV